MLTIRTFLAIAILFVSCMAAWSWSRVFWYQIDPWIRRILGRLWGVKIVWVGTPRQRAWGIEGPPCGRDAAVAGASILAWVVGLFAPVLVVGAARGLHWLPVPLGEMLAIASVCVGGVSATRHAGRAQP